MMLIRFVIVALLLFVVVTIASFVYLQWWQALIVIALMIVGIIVSLKLVLRSFIDNIGKAMIAGFEAKARVLRGATAEVHAVAAVPQPPPRVIDQAGEEEDEDSDIDDEDEEVEDEDDEDERELAYYRIDFTLRPPAESGGPMSHWDVSDLCVVDSRAKPLKLSMSPEGNNDYDAGEGFHFRDVQILEEGGQLQRDDSGKYHGEQRLNVVVGVPPELRELKFRYYTEQFGRIVLPPPYPRQGPHA